MKLFSIRFFTKGLLVLAASILFSSNALAQGLKEDPKVIGKKKFEDFCISCHNIWGMKSTGPNLGGVTSRPGRTKEWLRKWVHDNVSLTASGDPLANQLMKENPGKVMTVFGNQISDTEIDAIFEYVKSVQEPVKVVDDGGKGGDTVAAVEEPDAAVVKWINFFIFAIIIAVLAIIGYAFDLVSYLSKYTKIEIANADKINGWIMLLFLIAGMSGVAWECFAHGKYVLIGNSASEHGAAIDKMLWVTLIITGFVFVVTQIALFWFAFKYKYSPTRRAYYYPHNNTLELIWTIIPAIALAILVVTGFIYWVDITRKAPKDAQSIELFAYQFGWQARYEGKDGKLMPHSFNLISGDNPLGVAVPSDYDSLIVKVNKSLKQDRENLAKMLTIKDLTSDECKELDMLKLRVDMQERHLLRLKAMGSHKDIFSGHANDDVITQEIGLVKGRNFEFKLRARDVIHSAYSPHFRLQMNAVPGIPTSFWFKPTISTKEMRGIQKDDKFDYYLFCAKICGTSHYNMRIKITVFDTEAEYQEWLTKQPTPFMPKPTVAENPAAPAAGDSTKQDSTTSAMMPMEPKADATKN